MKAEEAKEKICPFMSDGDYDHKFVYCQTEECMAWKTERISEDNEMDRHSLYSQKLQEKYPKLCKHDLDFDDDDVWEDVNEEMPYRRWDLPTNERKGFCIRLQK